MKLVEVLARELNEWPDGAEYALRSIERDSAVIHFYGGDGTYDDFSASRRSSDLETVPEVTRAQWEEERARIAMEGISAFSQEQDQAEQARIQYEQELWDRVAQGWIAGAAADSECSWSTSAIQGHVEIACDVADAFMVERAKRLKERK